MNLGKCHLLLGQVDEAMPASKGGDAESCNLVCSSEAHGRAWSKRRNREARTELAQMVKLTPEMNSAARIRGREPYRNPQFTALHDRTIIQGLRNAGFPEEVATQQ